MPSRLTPQLIKAMPAPDRGNRIEWDEVEVGSAIVWLAGIDTPELGQTFDGPKVLR